MNFVSRVFGDENLNENLKFIADNIGMRSNETPKETIRRYFLNDFFNYHVSLYSTGDEKLLYIGYLHLVSRRRSIA